MGDVEDGVGHRHRGGQRGARLARSAPRACGHDEHRLEPGRHGEALGAAVRAQHEAAEQRGGDVVGMALEPRRGRASRSAPPLDERVRRQQPGHDRRRARPQAAGQRDVRADPEREAVGREQRLERPDARGCGGRGRSRGRSRPRSGRSPPPRRRRAAASAQASTSKPGPRLAEEAGTRTRTRRRRRRSPEHGALDGADVRLARARPSPPAQRRLRILEPVAGEHAHDALRRPPRRSASSPATPAADAGSQNTPSAAARKR